MNSTAPLNVLRVDASARHAGSVSRQLSDELIQALRRRVGDVRLVTRDLALEPPPFVDAAMVEANFTDPAQRTADHQRALAASDALARELLDSDVLVIGVPLYNFGIPAVLKAWIDMVTRARLTFRYTDTGVEGLLKGKRAYLLLATGGVEAGSAADFATTYLRHLLGFVGITDVEVIAADGLMMREDAVDKASGRIVSLFEPAAA